MTTAYTCDICLSTFASGQKLGGHKRWSCKNTRILSALEVVEEGVDEGYVEDNIIEHEVGFDNEVKNECV